MKIKNTSNKVISLGEIAILPDETVEVNGFENNEAVKLLAKMEDLQIIADKKASSGRK